MKTAGQFIEENYHIDAKIKQRLTSVLFSDKTKKEVTIEEVAQAYSDQNNKALIEENEKWKKDLIELGAELNAKDEMIQSLQSQLSELKSNNDRLSDELMLESQIATENSNGQEYLKKQLFNLQSQLTELKTETDKLNNEKHLLLSDVQGITWQLQSSQNRVNELEEGIRSALKTITMHYNNLDTTKLDQLLNKKQ